MPVGEIAQAIESKDARFLCELPEIGKRTAETIIVELSGKVDQFIEMKPSVKSGAAPVDDARSRLVHACRCAVTRCSWVGK